MQLHKNAHISRAIEQFSDSTVERIKVINDEGDVIGTLSIENMRDILDSEDLSQSLGDILQAQLRRNKETSSHIDHQYSEILDSPIFTDIVNSLHDGVFITNGDGVTVKVNQAYERITDLKAEQLVGSHMEDVIKAGYISKSASLHVLKEERPVTLMQKIANGRNIIVSGTPIFSNNGDILYVINSVRDITELLELKHQVEDLQELKNLRQSFKEAYSKSEDSPFYVSDKMKNLLSIIERVAKTDAQILMHGETGVGKTMIAKHVHEKSIRSNNSFLELNCGALPTNLIEAELFGYEAGAFTGALSKGKKGLLEVADQGTLFLDEIGDLPLELQVKLLKVIEDQAFYPVGSSKLKHIDVRIIAASHKNLKQLVKTGAFREDLYYRLNVVPIHIPPLRERKKEIHAMTEHFLNEYNAAYGFDKTITLEAIDAFYDFDWPGNIRELKNLIEQLVVTTPEDHITRDDLPEELIQSSKHAPREEDDIIPLKQAIEEVERTMITKAMRKYKTTRKVAEVLEVSQSTIVQKMKKWGE
ncbi:sigma-54 interaction domain-containing protein [Pontibacillus yanchengensis]|uniref:HTH-type transcriptional regulatory protein TyrR n=1 Tax=Pontibacillus yanchengensis Y32 TaxID=1385514 RepID=A0A0A2TJF2_9BACI|nr:sigma 54-interacting transcriptional regulator [Pontibacillus yanchengensis]KGP74573.1 Fis family transcriptional regulator [Pontibacillus yanchengensis Y32]